MWRCYFLSVLLVAELTVTTICEAEGIPQPPAIGSEIPDFTFTDIRFLPRQLSELGKPKAYVIVFATLDCPIVKRSLPKLRALDEAYRDKGVQFLVVNVGANDSLVDVAQQAVEADIEFPFGKDFSGTVVKALGATRTPECVVLDANRRLQYRGRIDSEFRFGGARPNPGRADLKEAIEDVLAGRKVQVPETPVDGCLITTPRATEKRELTYYKDVAPLMKKHCQGCHQPKTAAPFSLRTYDEVNANAAMIAEVVSQRRMPPWFAASGHGDFTNNPSLSSEEIATLVDWAKGDRVAGDPKEGPKPVPVRESDWLIGKPDLVIRMAIPEKIPATGYIPYRYTVLPYVFLQDTWVQKIQINPGNDEVVHHCNMGYVNVRDAGGKF
ncbi:MAG: redoxin family protein, partial [Planctomycetaceae bacterium]|nr:redoxin family protein [Planctomycetaceae bacterium]